MVVEPRRRLFTVEEYDRMVEAGVFHEDDRIELIEGEILEMSPIYPPHSGTIIRLTQLFTSRLGERVLLSVQNPVRMLPRSEPQPDVTVLRPRDDFYSTRHPDPTDVLLTIEVAESSLSFDRRTKMPLYARQGVREAWIVDVAAGRLEVYREPEPDGYATRTVLERGHTVRPEAFDDLEIAVVDVVGPA